MKAVLLSIALVAVGAVAAPAADPHPSTRLAPSVREMDANFGNEVAIVGDEIFVGALLADDHGSNSGAVVHFRRSSGSWVEDSRRVPTDVVAGDRFGSAIAAKPGVLAISTPLSDEAGTNSGSVRVYEGSGWDLVAKLVAPDAAANDRFGTSVAFSPDGGTLFVGADGEDDLMAESGAVYVFDRHPSGWTFTERLKAPTIDYIGDAFGYALAAGDGWLAAGSPLDDDRGAQSGSIIIFERDGAGSWVSTATLHALDGVIGARFGISLSAFGDRLATGALLGQGSGGATGSAYVFDRRADGTWPLGVRLLPTDGKDLGEFGSAVALGDGVLAVGEHHHGVSEGRVHLFTPNGSGSGWTLAAILTPADNTPSSQLGAALALSGTTLVAGAPIGTAIETGADGVRSGLVYVYDLATDESVGDALICGGAMRIAQPASESTCRDFVP